MNEPIEGPDPPEELPASVVEAVEQLSPQKLQLLIEFARSRHEYLEAPVSEFIEPNEGEEILRIDDRDIYTIVVKRETCEEGCEDCPHDPYAYVVTMEPDDSSDRHLHWVNIGEIRDLDGIDDRNH